MNTLVNKSKFKTRTLCALILALVGQTALAGKGSFVDVAHVTKATPIYTTIERRVPERECWVEQVREEAPRHRRNTATGTIVGGIIGGAIGNAVGAGSENKKVGAVVGTILGMSVGNDISRAHNRRYPAGYNEVSYRDVERCEVRHRIETEQELVGYDVTYRYKGRTYTTQMDHNPGRQLKVAVNIRPLEY